MSSDQNDSGKLDMSLVTRRRIDLIRKIHQTEKEKFDQWYFSPALCHVFFPRRDPCAGAGHLIREPNQVWEQTNGNYSMMITPLPVWDKIERKAKFLGVPFGAKSRLLLASINALALRQKSPNIHLEAGSLTRFLKNAGFNDGGNQISEARKQLLRLASCVISIYYGDDNIEQQINVPLVKGFDIFPRSSPDQLFLWNENITLSQDYFNEIQQHGFPLPMMHLQLLANNARAIDFYSFMAYRLHHLKKPFTINWGLMKQIFGGEISSMKKFKEEMRQTARLVKVAYMEARFEIDGKDGFTFHHSPPPIPKKTIITKL